MSDVRAIAFYLPQFHPVPENDEWWGSGFTEWRNVTRARPLFPGHYQPHLPADLGFYDLRLPEAREAQAALARAHGIFGFCYYHYWFNGRRILERPFAEVLASGKPDLPFCLCWANENWTRVWDGGDEHVLLAQRYDIDDDIAHIRSLLPALRDPRYVRINGRPLLLVYRTELLPQPWLTAQTWRKECQDAGVGDLYLAQVEHFVSGVDPASIGFDAAVEFAPDGVHTGRMVFRGALAGALTRLRLLPRAYSENNVIRYDPMVSGMLAKPDPPFKRFRCVTPMWDNSPRRRIGARIYVDATPEKYGRWLTEVVRRTRRSFDGDERIVFLNAWNEWAEGCHLEPDLKWGRGYLEATRTALQDRSPAFTASQSRSDVDLSACATRARRLYWSARSALSERAKLFRSLGRRAD